MAPDLDLPAWLTPSQQDTIVALAGRNDAAHGDDLLGLVLSGSVARGCATERSDLEVMVVLTDEAAAGRSTDRSPEVDEIIDSWADLTTVPPFGSEHWWYRWSYAWAPVLLDRTGGDLAAAVRRQATLSPEEADAVLIDHDRLDGWAAEDLLGLVRRTLGGDVSAVRETFARVREACAAHDERRGHTRTTDLVDGWGRELAILEGPAS
jgi:hypothetical protein